MVKQGNSWASFNEQLDYLAERGMIITDKAVAVSWLSRVGYYRLSGYWYALRDRRVHQLSLEGKDTATGTPVDVDVFRPGATFQDAVDLYVFDKQLRLLALDALERIEIAFGIEILSISQSFRSRAKCHGSLIFVGKSMPWRVVICCCVSLAI